MQLVQLVIRADLGQLPQGGEGERLAAAVEHEAAVGVFGPILGHAAGEGVALVGEDLEDGPGAPEGAEGGGGLDEDAGLAGGEGVGFRVGLVVGDDAQDNVAGLGALGGEGERAPETGGLAHQRALDVVGEGLGVTGEGVAGVLGDDDAGALGEGEGPGIGVVAPFPELGDDEGLRAPGGRRRHQHRGKECRFHAYSIALSRGARPLPGKSFLAVWRGTQGEKALGTRPGPGWFS